MASAGLEAGEVYRDEALAARTFWHQVEVSEPIMSIAKRREPWVWWRTCWAARSRFDRSTRTSAHRVSESDYDRVGFGYGRLTDAEVS